MAITARQRLIEEIKVSLGDGMIDIEADPVHLNLAITRTIDRYRQRSSNAMEESFVFLDTVAEQDIYQMPTEVQLVRYVYRRGLGATGSGGAVDPFSLAFTNNLYMMNNPGGLGQGGPGMLATYDFAMQYQSLAGRMFGREIIFSWNPSSKLLNLQRKFTATETLLLHCYNAKPEEMIINDVYAKSWVRDYAIAHTKITIGQARSKFSQIAGPQGGSTLNGEALLAEGKEEIERLDKELELLMDGGGGFGGYWGTIG